MKDQLSCAAGYLSIFLVPALLLAGIALGVPWLTFAIVMFVLPFARRLFRPLRPGESLDWAERVAVLLEYLPIMYAGALTIAIALVLRHLATRPSITGHEAVGLGLSLWMTMLFATCASHELIHRRNTRHAMVGYYIAGLAGYPQLGYEHLRHHARSADEFGTEWPRVSDSVWRFTVRRLAHVYREAYAFSSACWNPRARGHHIAGLRVATAVSVVLAGLFGLAAGWTGFAVFAGMVVGVAFGMQLFTYLQHWGLGSDRLGERAAQGYGWEDDCRLQAWMTLGISLHHAHHQESQRPYYRTALTPDSPRLPAGYVVLMVLCMFPGVWRKLMQPALDHWENYPQDPRSPGRNLSCFALYQGDLVAPLNR